jgi:PleD family two-component response regulator
MNTVYRSAISVDNKKKSYKKIDRTNNERRRILLVDDEPDICMVYQIVLEEHGFECMSYIDSVKGLQEFKPHFYDLILLDIKMPVLNGFEFYKNIIEVDKNNTGNFFNSRRISRRIKKGILSRIN